MVWFKVDDKFHGSDPVKRIPRPIRTAAIGLWTLAGAWSSDHLKDGYVPEHIVDDLGGTTEQAEALVAVKLWRRKRGGFQFTNWEKWQRTREQVEQNRAAERDRKATYRASRAGKSGEGPDTVPVGQERIPGTPDPTRPDPTIDNSSPRGTSPRARDGSSREEKSPHGGQPGDNYAAALAAFADRFNVDRLVAGLAVDWILGRAKSEPKMPKRYVVTAINRDPAEWERYALTGELPA